MTEKLYTDDDMEMAYKEGYTKCGIDAALASSTQPAHEDDFTQALQERDRYHGMADELAARIAAITGEDIGEHSSANCPWTSALNAADNFIASSTQPTAIYQYQTSLGSWIDQDHETYVYNERHGISTVRIVYTTPQPTSAEIAPHDLQKRLADLHLYEEIGQYYAKCNPGPEALRDWVAERMDKPSAVVQLTPVVVAADADADAMNTLHGERYGMDWEYPASTQPTSAVVPAAGDSRPLWQVAMHAFRETESKIESIQEAWQRVADKILSAVTPPPVAGDAQSVQLTADEKSEIAEILEYHGHGGRHFEAECPFCTAYRKLTTPSKQEGV